MTGTPGPARQYIALVVAATALLQACWIALLPPFRGSDEFDHAYRAAAVAGGEWRPVGVPADGRGLLVSVPPDLVLAAHAQCAALEYTGPDNCTAVGPGEDGTVLVASGASNYHPAFYWVVGTAARPFDGSVALMAMRFAGAALCLSFVGLAAWAAARTGGWGPRAGLGLAMPPVLIYSTAVPAPNGLEMTAALALWASLLALGRGHGGLRTERGLIAVAVVSASVMVTVRLLGPLFVLLILTTCLLRNGRTLLHALMRHRLAAVLSVLTVGACTAGSIAWILSADLAEATGSSEDEGRWPVSSLLAWTMQAIAAFPLRDEPGALVVYPVVLLVVGAFVVGGFRRGGRRDRSLIVLATAVTFLLPIVITVLTRDTQGIIWQGRYGLPYGVGIVLLAGAAWTPVTLGRDRRVMTWLGAGLFAFGTGACLLKIRTSELGGPPSAVDAAWHAPPAWLLVALVGVAFALLARAASRADR